MKEVKKRNYVISEAGELYIRAQDCGIPTMILLVDGIVITIFKGDNNRWIRVSYVLDWYKKEIAYGLEHGYSKTEIETYQNNVKIISKEKAKLVGDSNE